MNTKIKTIILTGFLGSGKTTLLSYLLNHDQFAGKKVAVLVNEFGKIPVDGALLPQGDYYVAEIDKGSIFCICVKTDLLKNLTEIARDHTPDVLIIEATGLAEPCDFTVLLQTDELKESYEKAATICVTDSINFPKLRGMMPAVRAQVQVADIVLVNKYDQISDDAFGDLEQSIIDINSGARIFKTEYSQFPLEEIDVFSSHNPVVCTDLEMCKPKLNAPESTSSCELKTDAAIIKQKFYEVMDKYRNNILRGKGIVTFDTGELYVEVINGVVTSRPAAGITLNADTKTAMVFILRQCDETAFLDDCAAFIKSEEDKKASATPSKKKCCCKEC